MKIIVSAATLEATTFEIQVTPADTIADVKKKIEAAGGANAYPAPRQLLIHEGEVLEDETTLEENKVAENSSLLVLPTKALQPIAADPQVTAAPTAPMESLPSSLSVPIPLPTPGPTFSTVVAVTEADESSRASSNLATGSGSEGMIQQILDWGWGGLIWDRDTVVHALRVARNHMDMALVYLFSEPPKEGDEDIVRCEELRQTIQVMAEAKSQVLQQTIQQLVKQNPQMERLANENRAEFCRQIVGYSQVSQEMERLSRWIVEFLSETDTKAFSSKECEAMQRLQALGFSEERAMEAYLVCDWNAELAANYLLDHHVDEPKFLVDFRTLYRAYFDDNEQSI